MMTDDRVAELNEWAADPDIPDHEWAPVRVTTWRTARAEARQQALTDAIAAVENVPGVQLKYPAGPKFIDHEEGCAFAYGNMTYTCVCHVGRAAVIDTLTRLRDES